MIPYAATGMLIIFAVADFFLLYRTNGVIAIRSHAERLSNGDDNPIHIHFENRYSIPVNLNIIDEIPHQFQKRDVNFHINLKEGEK